MADDFTLGSLRRLSDADFKVADNEPDVRGWTVVSRDGRTRGGAIGKRAVEGGEVRVGEHVETEYVRDQVDVTREQVHIERRPVSDARGAAEIGAATGEIRVPIVEEEVVVEKRPVVKEELVISKEQVHETRPVDVEVRKEQFDITDDRNAVRDRSADERTARKGDR